MLQHRPCRCLLSMSQRDPMGTDGRWMRNSWKTAKRGAESSGRGVNHAILERRAVYRCAARRMQADFGSRWRAGAETVTEMPIVTRPIRAYHR